MSAHPRPRIAIVQVRNLGNIKIACFPRFGTRDMSVVVARLSTCISEFRMSSQKSASVVEPGALLVEVWNARHRGIALMAMVNMVAVTRNASRFASGPRYQFTALFKCVEGLLTFWCVLSFLLFVLALTLSLLPRKESSNNNLNWCDLGVLRCVLSSLVGLEYMLSDNKSVLNLASIPTPIRSPPRVV